MDVPEVDLDARCADCKHPFDVHLKGLYPSVRCSWGPCPCERFFFRREQSYLDVYKAPELAYDAATLSKARRRVSRVSPTRRPKWRNYWLEVPS